MRWLQVATQRMAHKFLLEVTEVVMEDGEKLKSHPAQRLLVGSKGVLLYDFIGCILGFLHLISPYQGRKWSRGGISMFMWNEERAHSAVLVGKHSVVVTIGVEGDGRRRA